MLLTAWKQTQKRLFAIISRSFVTSVQSLTVNTLKFLINEQTGINEYAGIFFLKILYWFWGRMRTNLFTEFDKGTEWKFASVVEKNQKSK